MAQSHYLAAVQHHRVGQLAEAESLYQQVLSMQPKHADAHHMLGLVYYQTNRTTLAVTHIEQALTINPKQVEYLNHYGLALRENGQVEAAIKSFQQAILLQPKDLDIQLNLGNTMLAANRFEEAAGYYRRVLRVKQKADDIREALCHCLSSLGNQAHTLGNFVQAEACFQEALLFNPQDAALLYNLGNAQRELGKANDAAKQYQKAIQLAPNDADTHNNLGNVQRELGQLDLAVASYQKALTLNPKLHHAKVHLVHQKQHMCDWQGLEDDIQQIRQWVKHEPSAQISPFAFLAMPSTTAEEQKICASNWVNNRYAQLIQHGKQLSFTHAVASNKKIKIGYLSADFRLHPLAFLISELIELHDKNQFEIHAFSYGINDKTSARTRLEKAFDQFHDIRTLSEIDAAKKIHSAGIDILVDLTGFTQTSRSGIAALRPAKINVNWLGFPGTMGEVHHNNEQSTPLFDYLLSDSFITPPTSAQHYAEKLALLPHSYQPNDRKRPIGKKPTREACNLPENAFVFCSFNQSFKITPDVFSVWMRLLTAQPNSVLWLLDCNPWAKQNLLREANIRDIEAERIIFAPRVTIADHLARHAHADLFLDTQPYNAHTTCSDALWMGVPVLTCTGDTFASRVAGSLLQAAGLTQLISDSLEDYENIAMSLMQNKDTLTRIKEKLCTENMTSPLFDTAKFAQSLEETYRTMMVHHAI
ncbi:tetratricopeptide repeat protein [Methylotenera sp. L2L1]|uniref:O-linked N-acetylglucosamine transferase family protein n=1 Tax=Methylotenera sp. L2L1 TaxID=1502770 RepID=UPI00068F2257|nr:tetratricopeptide repeat protein [Methylotenera sp. L2L1]